MGERAPLTIEDIFTYYGQRVDTYLGRCEILCFVAESIREDQPKISRAITTIAEDMSAEIESMSDEIGIFLRAAQHNTIVGAVDSEELNVLSIKAQAEWAGMTGRHKQ